MGCDIHPFVEYTDTDGERVGFWVDMDRDYVVFELLAGVRWGAVHSSVYQSKQSGGFVMPGEGPLFEYVKGMYYTNPPIELPHWTRGVPSEAHHAYKDNHRERTGDAHSATWLSLDDMRAVQDLHTVVPRFTPKPEFTDCFAVCKNIPGDHMDAFLACMNACYYVATEPNADIAKIITLMEQGSDPLFLCFFDN